VVGWGWQLSGLSLITRCPRTKAQDGARGTVAYDANDRYCLDARRLKLVSGDHGAPDSQYRTEIETFSQVTAHGQAAGGGPAYFTVRTRDGWIMEFGRTADSSVPAAGRTPAVVRTWAVNSIRDVHGNTQTITYGQSGLGSLYPVSIDYTGNSLTGLAPASRVEFGYTTDRPDPPSGYQGGHPWQVPVRLTSITTRSGGAIVSTYTLAYDASTGLSRLASLSQCAPDGACRPVTTMHFPSARPPAYSKTTNAEPDARAGQWLALDIDADGRTDLVHLTNLAGQVRVWRSKGDGSFDISSFTTTVDTQLSSGIWRIADLDGDGRADMVHMKMAPLSSSTVKGDWSYLRVWRSNGDGTFNVQTFSSDDDPRLYYVPGTNGEPEYHKWQVVDADGDGRDDLVHHYRYVTNTVTGADIRTNAPNLRPTQ
jgi:hypothetical protein